MAPPSPQQRQSDKEEEEVHWDRLLCSYTGLAFSIFLALLPTSLISSFQFQIRILSSKLLKMEETIREMKLRRAEDAKANAKVVEIFASHRIGWRQEERRLRQQIEDSGGEIVFLRDRISELEQNDTELRAAVDKLQREIEDREDFIDFLSRKAVGEDVSKETATAEIKVFNDEYWKDMNFYREREIPVKNSEIREDLLRRERISMGAWRSMLDRGNFDVYPAGEMNDMVPDFSTHARQGMVNALDRGISVSYFADLSGNGRSMVAEELPSIRSFNEKEQILSRNLFFNSHDHDQREPEASPPSMISSPIPCSTIRSCESDFCRRSGEIRGSDVAEYEIPPSLRGSLGMSSRITTRKTRSDSLSEEALNPVTVHCRKDDPVPESISLFLLNDYPIYSPCRKETLLTILPESENPASNSFSGICSPGIGFPAKNLINGDMETFNYNLIEKPSLKDLKPPESSDSTERMKSFAARKEKEQPPSWKVVDHGGGHESLMAAPSSKMKFLEKELLNLERVAIGQKGELTKIPTLMRKQAKKYQLLCAEIDNLYRCMQEENDPISERSMISPPDQFRAQRQSEFLLQAMCLQQCAAEASQSLSAIQTEMSSNKGGQQLMMNVMKSSAATSAELDSRRSLESIKNNLREIQRSLEIWLARIMGGIEGILARREHAASIPH